MIREWYLIDDEGIHPLNAGKKPEDFWETFNQDGDEAPWPAFSQVVVQASPTRVMEALFRTGPGLGVDLIEVTDDPERWGESFVLARSGDLTVLDEPGVDLDDRVMALQWADELFGELRCDGAFFGYDPTAGTLHLTKFTDGTPEFAWCDSLLPGPSYAMIFDEDGGCVDEDPRRFALRKLGMPETSPLLDRYRFVTASLEELGLGTVNPELQELPVAAVVSVRPAQKLGSSDST